MLLVSLILPPVTPELFQLILHVLDSASSNLKPPWLLRSLNGQFLCVTPGQASILINEWVSLWDHCTVWRLGLHHSRKFLSHLRKPKLAGRSLVPFLQSKALMYFPHFYPDKFYNGSQIEEKCQISLLTTQPRQLSALQRSNLGIYQPSPGYSLIFFFFQSIPPYPVPFHWMGNSSGIFQPPPTQHLLTGWGFFSIFPPSPTQCLDHEWVCPRCFTRVPPSIFPTRRGQVTCSTTK